MFILYKVTSGSIARTNSILDEIKYPSTYKLNIAEHNWLELGPRRGPWTLRTFSFLITRTGNYGGAKIQPKTSHILNRAYLADGNAEDNGEYQIPLSAKTRHISQGSISLHTSMQITG